MDFSYFIFCVFTRFQLKFNSFLTNDSRSAKIADDPSTNPAAYNKKEYDFYTFAESEQETGSFKLRGAFSKLTRLKEHGEVREVTTASTGNHALACVRHIVSLLYHLCSSFQKIGKVQHIKQ